MFSSVEETLDADSYVYYVLDRRQQAPRTNGGPQDTPRMLEDARRCPGRSPEAGPWVFSCAGDAPARRLIRVLTYRGGPRKPQDEDSYMNSNGKQHRGGAERSAAKGAGVAYWCVARCCLNTYESTCANVVCLCWHEMAQ